MEKSKRKGYIIISFYLLLSLILGGIVLSKYLEEDVPEAPIYMEYKPIEVKEKKLKAAR